MFEAWKFRRSFGFAPSKEWEVASEAQRRVVRICLENLEGAVELWGSRAQEIEEGIRGLTRPKEILEAEARRCQIIKVQEKADHRLYEACRLAVRYGFQPVAKYSWLVKHEQERREKDAARLRDKATR